MSRSHNVSSQIHKMRSKRAGDPNFKYLVFPEGSNVQLVYCLTIATLTKPDGFFTFGVTAGVAYQLPYKTDDLPLRRSPEAYHRRSRRDLYHQIEKMLNARGEHGRECVLMALCRAGARERLEGPKAKVGLVDELLHSLFTFPSLTSSDEEDEDDAALRSRSLQYEQAFSETNDCERAFPNCPRPFHPWI
ncbi:hypothetical protein QAD02_024349 [Eretmocerus hayati]|uniref:Uncharacterized protein n=1 Tax=Eretmocerus hayati TaxID=131215 RepID=A0ACC2PY90_9HYME|nr:hypothetical protein QAD02_024349 [Eretmocerus hayati]